MDTLSVADTIEEIRYWFSDKLPIIIEHVIDIAYWEELDILPDSFIEELDMAITVPFYTILKSFNGTLVVPIVKLCMTTLTMAGYAAFALPFPRNPYDHIHRFCETLVEIFNKTCVEMLSKEMIKINDGIHKIQRSWRFIISNPDYRACRRRLLHDFNECNM